MNMFHTCGPDQNPAPSPTNLGNMHIFCSVLNWTILDRTSVLLRLQPLLHSPLWVEQLLQSEPRSVNRAGTGVDAGVVDNASRQAAEEGSGGRDPEVVVTRGPDGIAVAESPGHEAGTHVTGEVDGETGLETKGGADAELMKISIRNV